MKATVEILCIILSPSWVSPSITGLSYMDPLVQKPLPGDNPCNPLYWYPRHIPDYCYKEVLVTPKPTPLIPKPLPPMPFPSMTFPPIPLPPIPLPQMPMPSVISMPIPVPYPMPLFPSAVPQFVPSQMPIATNLMPMPMPSPYYPYPNYPQQAGLVPGVPGMVSQDGGINILPFSDAYSDMLEKHKQKLIRKRLQKVLDDYEDFPRKRRHRYRGKRH